MNNLYTIQGSNCTITDKDWLDLAWKYFQQHAQQRIAYFNFFVVFSTILTTGFVTTNQKSFEQHYLGIGVGVIQTFLSLMFYKIEERNRFLIKHSENIIKSIENKYESLGMNSYRLFTMEDEISNQIKTNQKKTFFAFRQITHGFSAKTLYFFFILIGVAELMVTIIQQN